MTSPKTASEFVQVLEQASLIAPVHLQKIRNQIPEPNTPGFDSKSFAKALVKEGLLTPFQAKRLMAGRREGFFIGKYRLLDILGQGGMGRVYLAEQITMKRAVALKLIRFGEHENPTVLVRFAREARAAAKLCHPNITQAYDFDQAGDYHYIAMEFIEGITIQDWVHKIGVAPWAQTAYYIWQAANALDHAHQAGLVHRDIKPGNLMIDVSGMLKLLDLGLVNIPTDDDSLTMAQRDLILGTADYVAPEQAVDSHTADIRADLYSLGGVAYYMLTGRPPFEGKSAAQKIIAHQTKDLQPVQETTPDIPKRFADIVHKLMAKKPEDRYQTPAELVHALKSFAQVAARPTPPYDLSLVRFSRETVDKYLRFGVDAPPANNVPPPSFGMMTMSDFRVPADSLTPKPTGDLGSSVIKKIAKPMTPRDGTAAPKSGPRSSAEKSPKSSAGIVTKNTPTPPTRKRPMQADEATSKQPETNAAKRRLRLAIFFIVPNLIAAAVVLAMLLRSPQPEPGKDRPAAPPRATVAIGQNDSVAALAKAVAEVAPDGQVLLEARSGSLQSASVLVVGSKQRNRGNFTLASKDKNDLVTLTAVGNEPILRITSADGFLLRDIVLDGRGQSGPLVEIHGRNPGVTLQNVIIRNVTGEAIRIIDAQGSPDRPIRLINLSFSMADGSVPISLQANSFDGWSRNIEIVGCALNGRAAAGMLVAQPVDGLTIRSCVFSQATHGIRFAPAPVLPDATAMHDVASWQIISGLKTLPKFDPSLPGDSQPLQWTKQGGAPVVLQPGAALAYSRIQSAMAGPRRLFIAADDAITVWVNGQKVFEHAEKQAFVPREFTAVGNFHGGDNHIWVQTNASKFAVAVAENYLPLTAADWRNVKIESNLFDSPMHAIEFAAAPGQESIIRVMSNQFRHSTYNPLAALKSGGSILPGTILATGNTDEIAGPRNAAPSYEAIPLR
jgi:serine/threonine protein kinase